MLVPPPIRPARPPGVVVLTILQIISGVGDIFMGILLLLAYTVVTALAGVGAVATAFLGLGMVALGLAVFSFALAYGVWTGEGWAWSLSIIGAVIGLCLGVLGLVVGGLTLENLIDVVPIALYALILAYLYTRKVRAYFGKAGGITVVPPLIPAPASQPYPPLARPPPPQPAQQPYYPQPQLQQEALAQPTPWGLSACPNCGNPLQPGVNFCDRCGTRLR